MLLPLNWLKEYVNVKMPPAKLAEMLTMAGVEVGAIKDMGNDKVFEIEITPNRPDWLSIIGLAREVAAINKAKLKIRPRSKVKNEVKEQKAFFISVQDKKDCPLYSARLIRDCKVTASSKDIARRLESVDLRPVNNIVDLTNFCLYEQGQPMHAFDFDKIDGSKVIVRRAREGEKIVTIDGIERKLDPRILIIADASRPIAIAGIMGGKDTEVTDKTKNVLLESACFDAVLTRRASRMLGLSTDSSYRFERKVDPDNVIAASGRCTELIKKVAKGKIGEIKFIGAKRKEPAPIVFKSDDVNRLLGTDLKTAIIKDILLRLGFKVKAKGKAGFKVRVPSFRQDVNLKEDLIEEIARISGYDDIPETMPVLSPNFLEQEKVNMYWLEDKVRSLFTAQGLDEAITYALTASGLFASCVNQEHLVRTVNPLSAEQEVLRPLLAPGLISAVQRNKNRQVKQIHIFEIGHVYMDNGNIDEVNHLSAALSAQPGSAINNSDIFSLKGILENLTGQLGIDNISYEPVSEPLLEKGKALKVKLGSKDIGFLGEVRASLLNSLWDINEAVCVMEINLEIILEKVNLEKKFTPIAKFPASMRDLSIVLDKNISYQAAKEVIIESAGKELKELNLLDVYTGKQVPKGKKSLSFSLAFQSPSRTLTEEDLNRSFNRILSALRKELKAELR